jgi:P4 family phage/plasmid primase-like protien
VDKEERVFQERAKADFLAERKSASGSDDLVEADAVMATPFIGSPGNWFRSKFPGLSDAFGEPVLEQLGKDGIVRVSNVSEDFLAATLGEEGSPACPAVFLPTEQKFFVYSPAEGIWEHVREPVLIARTSRLLLDSVRESGAAIDNTRLAFSLRDSTRLAGVIRKAKGLLEVKPDFFSSLTPPEYIACRNGMLRLTDKTLLPFNAAYRKRAKLAVPFDQTASCPHFLETLMKPAIDAEDLDLLQRWCGLALIGENLAQKILILTGTPGGGKGTFVRVLTGVIGSSNLASLRTQLLGERFEVGRFLGKTLLYGADVTENFLNHRSASVLKSLTGADPIALEFKNSNESPVVVCKFNVLMTCNSRLSVRLEGDTEAWRRRLLVIRYRKPRPTSPVADLDQQILRAEGSGVLNWMLEGVSKIRADGYQLRVTAAQQQYVDDLLLESDGLALFVRECLARAQEKLTVTECFASYVEYCNNRGWAAVARNKFGQLIGDEVARQHGVTLRNDIPDPTGKSQRGWASLKVADQHIAG